MAIEHKIYRNHYYSVPAMQPQCIDTAILKTFVDRLVTLGVIGEIDRFHIYSEAAAVIQELPGDNIDIVAEMIMLADSTLDDDGELKTNGKV